MNGETDIEPDRPGDDQDAEASERRIYRNTYIVIALAIAVSLVFASWPMVAGIAIGSVLCVFNERWLRVSVGAILGTGPRSPSGSVARWRVSKFLLRYAVIGTVVGLAFWSRKVDLIGFGIGFASFVWAAMMEAGYQLYLTFKPKTES